VQTTHEDHESEPSPQKEQAKEAAGTAMEKGQEVAGTAAEKGREVAETAMERGKEVAESARSQAADLASEATAQARNVVDDAKHQVKNQAQVQTDQIADALRRLEEQARALLEGRPDEAGPIKDYARQAADQIGRLAERTQSRGLDGLIQELQSFGRNRPGTFLAGAAAAGFVAARMMRAGAIQQAARPSGTDGGSQGSPTAPSTATYGTYPAGG